MKRQRLVRFVWPAFLAIFLLAACCVLFTNLTNRRQPLLNCQIIRPPHEVSALAEHKDTLWAGGREGVFAIDRKTGKVKMKLESEPPLEYVTSLLVDRQGVLWIGHKGGLAKYDGHVISNLTVRDGLPDNRVNCLMEDSKGRLWAGTWGGAACLEGGRWRIYSKKDGLIDDMVNVMLEDSYGCLWFGSYAVPDGGVSYYGSQGWQTFSGPRFLPDNNICDMIEDHTGRIWIATGFVNRGGAAWVEINQGGPGRWGRITKKDGLTGDKVRSIFEDKHGTLWFASEYDGVARWKGDEKQVFTIKSGLSGNEVKDWLEDENGNLWLATDNGITKLIAEGIF